MDFLISKPSIKTRALKEPQLSFFEVRALNNGGLYYVCVYIYIYREIIQGA